MSALWTSEEIAAATGGIASAPFEVTGVTFDSREVAPGDLFVAMPGTAHDGHQFVAGAFAAGAAGAIVSQAVDGPHVLVDNTFAALQALGRAARDRCQGRVVGVTGSVGKTSTKEALFAALDRCRPGKVHRSVKSYNNHTGVPLSLARMPRDTEFAILEMGMNNAGEIAALTRQVRPHVTIITAIAPAHIENLGSEEAIADAKAEIFQGLQHDSVAIVPNDTPHRDRLVKAARRHADRIITFGGGDADIHAIHAVTADGGGSLISAVLLERELTFTISQPGEHWVSNSLAVVAAVEVLGADVAVAGLALADMGGLRGPRRAPPAGARRRRGSADRRKLQRQPRVHGRHSQEPRARAGRRPPDRRPRPDARAWRAQRRAPRRPCSGRSRRERRPCHPHRRGDAAARRARWTERSRSRPPPTSTRPPTLCSACVRPGDAVLVKASNSVGLARLVDRVAKELACST